MIGESILPRKGETRFIFFNGKGGVGKSTMSCATAVWLARKGYKTLLVTTDPAPNLSDIFGRDIGPRITPLEGIKNLSAIEINPDTASEEYRERIVAPMREILDGAKLRVIREQLNSPCVEEVAAFDKFIEFMDDPQYDAVIFDTAPTGHTLRLLELPSSWSREIERGGSTCIGPSASLQAANTRYEKAIAYLQDDQRTTVIFVLRAEVSSVLETKRSSGELAKLGIQTNFLIVNGILPEETCTDEFFSRKKGQEEEILGRIRKEFGMPKVFYPLKDSEVLGLDSLEAVADYLYEGKKKELKTSMVGEALREEVLVADSRTEIQRLLTPVTGTRHIFFTGKGGVGKSTLACTTALHLAERGFKTLILTTDPASHLHDILGQEIGHEPMGIRGIANLRAARIDQKQALREYRKRVLEVVKGKDEATRKSVEEDLNSPCAEEMAAFEKFMSYFEPDDYDIIVLDTAPTGHTLRLLELPSDWKGFIDLGTLTKKTSDKTSNKYAHIIDTMKDKDKSTFVFVMFPEYTPIIEAWRASEDLKKQVGIETGMVAVNYLLPREYGQNNFFNNRRKQQVKYLSMARERFQTPMVVLPLLDHEPRGISDLRSLGKSVYGD